MPDPREDAALHLEYEQVNENFRMLTDIRFKLLALVPALGGVAVFLLSSMQGAPGPQAPGQMTLVLLVSILGLMATLGIVAYDQRNSEIYNALFDRAAYLEQRLKFPSRVAASRGGQFQERPRPGRRLLGFLLMKHDYGLSLAYAPVLGAWLFPIGIAVASLRGTSYADAVVPAARLAVGGTLVFLEELLRMDGFWRRLMKRLKVGRKKQRAPWNYARFLKAYNRIARERGGRRFALDGRTVDELRLRYEKYPEYSPTLKAFAEWVFIVDQEA